MKKVEIKFTTVLVIILAIILTTATVYIFNTVQGKYVLNKQIQIGYTTPDYYFEVSADQTEISSFPATINVTVKNHNGTNYTTDNIVYTIGVDNANYTANVADGNTRTLKGGSKQEETYAVTIDKIGTDSSDKINLTFEVSKPYSDSKSIELTVSTIPGYYGAEVTNYSAGGVDNWRIFHKDEEGRVYLIADDYIEYDQIPVSCAGNKLNKGGSNSPNAVYFSNIINDYTGSAWINEHTNEDARRWLKKYLDAYPDSENENMKAVAYMMDTSDGVWGTFVDKTCAEYAIGGPTLELFCASYKVTHPDRYIECDYVDKNGYQVKLSDVFSYSDYVMVLIKDDFQKIYINSDGTKAAGYWMSSPVINGASMMGAQWNGYVGSNRYDWTGRGFRPIVCLKAGFDVVSNGNGTYRIEK